MTVVLHFTVTLKLHRLYMTVKSLSVFTVLSVFVNPLQVYREKVLLHYM